MIEFIVGAVLMHFADRYYFLKCKRDDQCCETEKK